MLIEQDKSTIIAYAKQFDVQEMYLFGSSLESSETAQDIALAVRGIAPEVFFDCYGKLLRALSKPVDLVNLGRPTRFTQRIEKQAVQIYGKSLDNVS